MESVRQKMLRPKHQMLILKCYPRLPKNSAPSDVKPNSSELSYLMYYAGTRKSKLQKIGAYLEKKTASDVYRWQSARVLVTLQILTAMLENKSVGTGPGFPLFAPYVLRIIREILQNTNDVGLVEATLPTWDVFCRHQDQATLAAEHEYRALYEDVVGRYAAFARKEGKKKLGKNTQVDAVQDAVKLREAGLGALKSVLVSDALASESGRQLDKVIPAVLSNMRGDDEVYLGHLVRLQKMAEHEEKEKALLRRQSMAPVRTHSTSMDESGDTDPRQAEGTAEDADNMAEEEVAVLALGCLRAAFATDNRPQIKTATSALLRDLASMHARPATVRSEKNASDSSDFATSTWATRLFEMCTAWTAVQDRFILMVTTVETLVRVPLKEADLRQHLLYTTLIDHILRSDLNLIGLSVMDVLLSLIQQILRVLQLAGPRVPGRSSAAQLFSSDEETKHPATAEASEKATPEMPSEARMRLIARLKNCIADLGTHVYYTDQITDMLAALLMRLKPNPTPNASQQNPLATAVAIEEPQSAVVEIASNVSVSARQRSTSTGGSGFFTFDTARQIALEAVRDVIVVANRRGTSQSVPSIFTTGPDEVADSRNKVPLSIWEGTQWLLRDPAPEVRRAYVDALTTWLNLETSKKDARIALPKQKTPKRQSAIARRAVSNASRKGREDGIDAQSKKTTNTFLQLLHLAVFENALHLSLSSSPQGEKDIAVLHLLLTTLTQKLGVNAVQSALPMVLALGDEIPRAKRADQKIRLGSLVLGYLWAIIEVFELDVTSAGTEVFSEISRRRAQGLWMKEITVQPASLQQIAKFTATTSTTEGTETDFKPFTNRQALVDLISDAYAASLISSPTPSAPGSPGRTFTSPALDRSTSSYLNAKQPPNPSASSPTKLPDNVKQDMLEPWNRESCLAAIAAAAPKSASLSGSRSSPGHVAQQIALGTGNHRQLLAAAAAGSPHRSRNPSVHRQQGFGSRLHSPDRRQSNSTPNGRAGTSSSAGVKGMVKVEDLKRVLAGGGPALGFAGHANAEDTASESLVDVDVGFDAASEEGGFATPPSRGQSRPRGGEEPAVPELPKGLANGQGASDRAPVLHLPSDVMTGGEIRPASSSSARNGPARGGGNGVPPPPSSRGGASVKSRGGRTKKELRALLEGVGVEDEGERGVGLGAPPY